MEQVKEKETCKVNLDMEWVILLEEARQLGLTSEEVRAFFSIKKRERSY